MGGDEYRRISTRGKTRKSMLRDGLALLAVCSFATCECSALQAIRAASARVRLGTPACALGPLSGEEAQLLEEASGASGGTYGEITAFGFRTLMGACELGGSDVFVDLGSGGGAAVLQAAADFGVRHAVGVELAPSRHAFAIAEQASAAEDVRARTSFVEGDIGDPSVAGRVLEDASVVWLSNLLFGPELMQRVATLVESAPAVRIVAVLKPIEGGLQGFVQDSLPVLCQMSWTKPSDGVHPPEPGHPCVIYRRTAAILTVSP